MTTISENTTITQDNIKGYTFPVYIENLNTDSTTITITIGESITLSSYFIVYGNYIIFDGGNINGYIITISNVTNYPGLINNIGFTDITIENITVISDNSTLVAYGGWVGQSQFGIKNPSNNYQNVTPQANNIVSNCNSTGDCINDYSGGILGNYSYAVISYCSSSGSIGNGGGGIVGSYCIGSSTTYYSLTTTINYCNSTGEIGDGAGGIAGTACFYVNVSNCSSSGSIGYYAGGILGESSGGNLYNCFSSGQIYGEDVVKEDDSEDSNKDAYDGAGGLIGNNSYYSIINNCFTTGAIGFYCGGLLGPNANYDGGTTYVINGVTTITDCYSLGSITSEAGGLIGYTPTGNGIDITNCYSYGAVTDSGDGMFVPNTNSTITLTNTYVANGTWDDDDANSSLIGTDGTVWIVPTDSTGTIETTKPYYLYSSINDTETESSMNVSLSMKSNRMSDIDQQSVEQISSFITTIPYLTIQNNTINIPLYTTVIKKKISILEPPINGTCNIQNNILTYTPNYLFSGIDSIKFEYYLNNIKQYLIILIIVNKICKTFSSTWVLKQNITKIYNLYTRIISNFNYNNSLSKLKLLYNKGKSNKIYKYVFYNIVNKNIIKYSKKNIYLLNKLNINNTIIKYKCKKYILFIKSIYGKIKKNKKIIIYTLVETLDDITKIKLKKQMKKIIKKKNNIESIINLDNSVYYIIVR